MSKTPEATRHHNLRKLSTLLPLRAIQNLTFSNETPCSKMLIQNHFSVFICESINFLLQMRFVWVPTDNFFTLTSWWLGRKMLQITMVTLMCSRTDSRVIFGVFFVLKLQNLRMVQRNLVLNCHLSTYLASKGLIHTRDCSQFRSKNTQFQKKRKRKKS